MRISPLIGYRELMSRQALLTMFAALMLALAIPASVLLLMDDRTW